MTPAARLSAAIEILDRILAGDAVEPALTNWARGHRFAGSGDRNAIRDHVFDALRARRSSAALGGGETGRGLVLGLLRAAGRDPEGLFTGEGHAPAPLTADDTGRPPTPGAEALDVPDWLYPRLARALGPGLEENLQALRSRAPVFLRVNPARASLPEAISHLAEEGITAEPFALAPHALRVTNGARRIAPSRAYAGGMVELQDAASQAVIAALPLADGMRVLDFCAGGGGKALAMAASARLQRLDAHDAHPRRMADLPARAARAGADIRLLDRAPGRAAYDLVLTDVPCSGSGSWRRDPAGKWRLTEAGLGTLQATQAAILDQTRALVRPGGWLAYATCSVLREENHDQIEAFLARTPGARLEKTLQFLPAQGCDGFFLALMQL